MNYNKLINIIKKQASLQTEFENMIQIIKNYNEFENDKK